MTEERYYVGADMKFLVTLTAHWFSMNPDGGYLHALNKGVEMGKKEIKMGRI